MKCLMQVVFLLEMQTVFTLLFSLSLLALLPGCPFISSRQREQRCPLFKSSGFWRLSLGCSIPSTLQTSVQKPIFCQLGGIVLFHTNSSTVRVKGFICTYVWRWVAASSIAFVHFHFHFLPSIVTAECLCCRIPGSKSGMQNDCSS